MANYFRPAADASQARTAGSEATTISSTRAVDRAVQLLAQVCEQGEIGLTECARRVQLPPSTALRLLRTLESSGLITRDDQGLFRAGPRLVQLGASALSRQSLVQLAEPALRRIVAGCGESAYFSLPGADGTAIYAAMVEGVHSVRHIGWVGRSIPLDGTAAGAALRGEVSRSGYALVRSAVEPDVSAVAAPVRRRTHLTTGDDRGVVAGALSVVGPTYRIDDDQAALIGDLLVAEARSLSDQLSAPAGARPMSVVRTG